MSEPKYNRLTELQKALISGRVKANFPSPQVKNKRLNDDKKRRTER